MAFQGFDKNSGPGAPPKAQAQTPFGYFPRPPSPTPSLSSPPLQRSPRELEALERMHSPPLAFESIRSALGPSYTSQGVNRPTGSSPKWGDGQKTFIKDYNAQAQQRPAAVRPFVAFRNSATGLPTKSAQVQDLKRTRSPPLPSTDEDHLRNSGTVIGSHSVTWRTQSPPLNFQNNRSLDDLGPSFSEAQRPMGSSSKWGDGGNGQKSFIKDYNAQTQQRPSSVTPFVAFRNSGTGLPVKSAQVQDLKRARSPPLLSTDEDHLRNSRTVIGSRSVTWGTQSPPLNIQNYHSLDDLGPAFSEAQRPEWANQPKLSSNFPHLPTQQDLPFVSPYVGTYDSIRNFPTIQSDVHAPKRTRSPPIQYTSEPSREDSLFAGNDSKRPSLSPPILGTRSNGRFNILDTQNHSWSPPSAHVIDAEAAATKPTNFALPKRTRSPSLPSSDQVFQGNSYSAHDDSERELQAKAKRLARFKDELSQPEQSNIGIGNQKVPVKRHDQSAKQKFIGEPSDMAGDFPNADYEGPESSSIIIGLCPDMCPEMERGERERKGDLDHYERLDGDRNQTNKSLAVKKYTRTAEREANLIRPMPILQKTLDYLLNLLDQPYDDRFLSLYNFLWDRMRAIRMDLRMQHIFNLEAITMLEQMIRLHIIAMHELCEYTKGEGFSEGFDAHLNIEQMNKTSVELFQLYDDHRKRGSDVPTEKEFRGYYALLKLDKHPGYKVEPAELSLDLAKMTPEIRQTPEVLFARDVARACRTGNFIAFFRLARKASYLQACLMHAHFAKLRSQALASIHCGLQNNQGIPVAHVATWLGMEEEDIENLVEYHGYLIKEFEEPYMVKEGPFLNGDDYPLKCSKLVHKKKSKKIVENVSSPCLMELMSSKEVKELQSDKVYENEPPPVLFSEIKNSAHAIDDEMPDYEAVSSPKDDLQVKPMLKTLVVGQWSGDDHQMVAVSPLPRDFSLAHSSLELPEARARSEEKSNSATFFRNSLEKNVHSDMKATPLQIMPKRVELDRLPVLQMDSAMENPVQQSLLIKDSECEEHTSIRQEVETDEVNTSYDYEEVAEAKLKLILRIWRRRSSKKRELREQKQLAANAALSSLSMGTPIRSYNDWPSICHQFNIDRVMSERSDKHERSWSRLNVSDVIATKLSERNSNAKCLCWKMILCFQMDNPDGAKLASWLRSKLMPSRKSNDEDDLVISSTDLSIWKKWVPSHSNGDLTCCLSVIKDAKFNSLHESIVGASAILFVVYESIPWELQKIHLHNLLMCLPSGSHFPLLILSGSEKDYSDPSTIAQNLGLHEVDKSQISTFLVVSLVQNQHMEHLDGFFSDEQLREGLQWLASRSPLQPVLRCVKPRELVLTYLSPSLEVLDGFSAYKVSPDHCISALNEALDRSIEEVSAAANANPSCWPCPEITSLVESSNEHKAVEWYLPSIGWSSSARIEPLLGALSHCKLPTFSDDTSWLSRGSEMGNDIENQSLQLEECLVQYLTQSSQIMGLSLAKNEARIMLQKCARLELHNSTYYIVPNWVMIFRRIFNWQLMNLSNGVFSSSAYILEQQNSAITTSGGLDKLGLEGGISSHYYLIHPSLDEMVEVGCSSFMPRLQPLEYEAGEPFSGRVSNGSEVQKAINESASTEVERNFVQDGELVETNKDNLTNGLSNTSSGLVVATKATKEADRLSKLLEQCNIVQNMIDKKLGIYF